MNDDAISVEVAYALPADQCVLSLTVAAGTSLREAVVASSILQRYPEIVLDDAKLGVYGVLRSGDTAASPGDRIEIYRGLQADPKVVRRQRVADKRRRRAADSSRGAGC